MPLPEQPETSLKRMIGEEKLQLSPVPQLIMRLDTTVGEELEISTPVEAPASVKPLMIALVVSPPWKITPETLEGVWIVVTEAPPTLVSTSRLPLKLIDSLYVPGETSTV